MQAAIAQSTIDATIWLLLYQPDRLKPWLNRHQPAAELIKAAIEQIKSPERIEQAKANAKAALG